MTLKQLEEAVERTKNENGNWTWDDVQDLRTLAQEVIDCNGFPEEVKVSSVQGINEGYWVTRINNMRHLCLIARAKEKLE